MSVQVSYPGVYTLVDSSGSYTIVGTATSIAAFVGYTARGRDNTAQRLSSFSDFERAFGGLAIDSELSYGVQQFFANGGTDAYVVRVPKHDAVAATLDLYDGAKASPKVALSLTAISKGAWANRLVVDVDYGGAADDFSFNLTITDRTTNAQEVFLNLSADSTSTQYCVKVLNDPDSGSELVTATAGSVAGNRPLESGTVGGSIDWTKFDPKQYDNKQHDIQIAADAPAALTTPINVTIMNANDPIPGSILGLARLVERRVNAALQIAAPGAAVRCVVNASGDGLRIYADFDPDLVTDGVFDASLSFSAGKAGSWLATLALPKTGDAAVNVGHYVLGVGRATLAQNRIGKPKEGVDGTELPYTDDLVGDPAAFTGIYALDKVDLFNLVSIPDANRAAPGDPNTLDSNVDPTAIYQAVLSFFETKNRRAFLLIDPPPYVTDVEKAADWKSETLGINDPDAAAYFPRLRLPDPLNGYKLRSFAPSGVIAGLYARIDANRGVWKAPAGIEATLSGVQGQTYALTDLEHGVLNKLGLNCTRNFPTYGNVAWGSRTLVGSDDEASEWKYVPVRRTARFIEETLFRALKWVVFEPNDPTTRAQIRLNVRGFMQDLFVQGAFQGTSPDLAYQIKCDDETTTQVDVDNGIVNISVAFAPLKPAEFVVITIQQLAGQTQS